MRRNKRNVGRWGKEVCIREAGSKAETRTREARRSEESACVSTSDLCTLSN